MPFVFQRGKGAAGLGIKKLENWNRADILNHAWVNLNLINGRCFWLLKVTQNANVVGEKFLN
jgi:hypothetical protein